MVEISQKFVAFSEILIVSIRPKFDDCIFVNLRVLYLFWFAELAEKFQVRIYFTKHVN